jgi:hypothetical protein
MGLLSSHQRSSEALVMSPRVVRGRVHGGSGSAGRPRSSCDPLDLARLASRLCDAGLGGHFAPEHLPLVCERLLAWRARSRGSSRAQGSRRASRGSGPGPVAVSGPRHGKT